MLVPRRTISHDQHSQLAHMVPISTFSGQHPSDKPGPAGDELPASRALWISLHHIGEGSNSELQSGRLSSKLGIGQVDEN
jgi:hypothetical protein